MARAIADSDDDGSDAEILVEDRGDRRRSSQASGSKPAGEETTVATLDGATERSTGSTGTKTSNSHAELIADVD